MITGLAPLNYTDIFTQLDSESLKSLSLINKLMRELVENLSNLKITYQLKRMDQNHIFLQLLHYADFHDATKTTSQLFLSRVKTENISTEEVDAVTKWVPYYLQLVVEYAKTPVVAVAWHPNFGDVDSKSALYQTVEGLGLGIIIKRRIEEKHPDHVITFNPRVTFSDTNGEFSRNWILVDGKPLWEYEDRVTPQDL